MANFKITSNSLPNFWVNYEAEHLFEALEMFDDEYGEHGKIRGMTLGANYVFEDLSVELVPEPTMLISWYEHDCDFVTSFCDQNGHLKHAHIPERILHEFMTVPPKDK